MLKTVVSTKIVSSMSAQLEKIADSLPKKDTLISVAPLINSPDKKSGVHSNTSAHAHDVSGTTKSTVGLGERPKTEEEVSPSRVESIATQP